MLSRWNLCLIMLAVLIVAPSGLEGYPADPVAAAADPAVAASPPVDVAAPPPAAPPPQAPVGSGEVTHHKNPDGSTTTITRYNGPLPASAFQNPFASGPFQSPFGFPFGK